MGAERGYIMENSIFSAKDDAAMREAASAAIPEFKRFNIIENEVRNVI